MHYILIASVWLHTHAGGGYLITTQEFTSQVNCERAKQVLSVQLADGKEFHLDCVEK